MKRAKFKNDLIHSFYLEDCQRIQRVLLENGYDASLDQCERAWHSYGEENYCAGWLVLPKEDQEIFERLKPYLVPDLEEK